MDQPFNFPIPDVDWQILAPYAVLTVFGILGLVAEMLRPKHRNDLLVVLTLGGFALTAFLVGIQMGAERGAFGDMIALDGFGSGMQLVILLSAGLCVLFSEPYLRQKRVAFGEFYPLLTWASLGAMLMVATTNLLVVFIGLEILSIALYVMAGLSRQEEKSEESAMKYFLLGAFASAFLLFGIAFLYGGTGSLDIQDISLAWASNVETRPLLLMGLAFVLVGLGFKSSFVPFHQWTPDVYQGAPTNVTAFMATVAKVGAFGVLWRLLEGSVLIREYWLPALSALAILTMLVGNFVALTQKDVKRILAYSSIANAGYVLVGILAGVQSSTVVYFLLSYSFMTIGAFAVLSLAAKNGEEPTNLDDLKGLWQRSPIAAGALCVCMISLIGVPPTAGFFGKLLIFRDAVSAGLTPLAIVLAISSVISIYYYLAIAFAAFSSSSEPVQGGSKVARTTLGTCAICVVGILGLAIFFSPIMDLIVTGGR